MKDMLKTLLTSKKFLVALLALVTWVAGKFGFALNSEELLPVVTPLWAYIIGQGIADTKKLPVETKAP